jgi:hypothetical protein
MRNLASIQRINKVIKHPNADSLDIVSVKGWNVVVKKGEFQPSDLCVYMEIDSLLPERPEFEFLASKKYRIKTIKFRGQVSQGIAFPIGILESIGKFQSVSGDPRWEALLLLDKPLENGDTAIPIVPGEDVTEALGITKYEEPIPACLGGTAKGRFPSHSIKTDEERIQNLKENYEEYKQHIWVATEKADGCLDENTVIETKDGSKTIKEICETEYKGLVRTFNLETHKEEFRKILGYSVKESTDHQWFEIELENGNKIKITGNHEVWIPKLLCWRRVDELDGTEDFLLKN